MSSTMRNSESLDRERRVAPALATGLAHRFDFGSVIADRELDPAGRLDQFS